MAKILGDAELSVGGDPHFVPDEDIVDSLLPQIPSLAPLRMSSGKKSPQLPLLG